MTFGNRYARLLIAATVSFGATACQLSAPDGPAAEPEPAATRLPSAPRIDEDQLYRWLTAADAAIEAEHLTYPEVGSAYAIYQQILSLDPQQEDALRGLERIVETFVAMSMAALEDGQFALARSMLARARIILRDHPSIEPAEEQIRMLEDAQRTRLSLKQNDLEVRDPKLVEQLIALARPAVDANCRFTIFARNDAQGRWIYQTLSKASSEVRLRAEMQIATPARVERLCFTD